ncbi:MAG: right-handed parallel beta-helix repeat-containing protein [Lysobacteraceae bacterium]
MRTQASLAAGIAFCLAFSAAADAATFTVTSTANSGAGTLRQAIIDANVAPDADTINFNIAGAGVHDIALSSALPDIIHPLTINGYSQPGSAANSNPYSSNAVILIDIHPATPFAFSGLQFLFNSTSSKVSGIALNRFGPSQLSFLSDDCRLTGSFIGLAADGTTSFTGAPGTSNGVVVQGDDCEIGGNTFATRNVVSGNISTGIYVASDNVLIQNNLVGTSSSGGSARPNNIGIQLGNGGFGRPQDTLIGGEGAVGNTFSGNALRGIHVLSADGTRIQGNVIGRTPFPLAALPNGGDGIHITDGTSILVGPDVAASGTVSNIIASNGGAGVLVSGDTTTATIIANQISSNGGLPIDISPSTDLNINDAQDADTGPNGLQNHPVVTSSDSSGPNTVIEGTLHSTPNSGFFIDVYRATSCEADGRASVSQYLGYVSAATNASGDATWLYNHGSLLVDGYIVATASTSAAPSQTSEFSLCVPAVDAEIFADGFESP